MVVNGRWRHHADATVAMLRVVPIEEALAMGAGILDAAEAFRKVGAIFQGPELRLRERVVVGDVGSAVGLGDVQIDQQLRDGLGAHAGAAVGVQGQRARLDRLLGHGVGDQLLGQLGGLAQRDHPAHDVAAEDVQDHVEVEVAPLHRSAQLGDVPAPDLTGAGGQQLGLGVAGVGQMVTAFADRAVGRQQPVHGAHRTKVAVLVEQRGVDASRCHVGEPVSVEYLQDRRALLGGQGQGRPGPRPARQVRTAEMAAALTHPVDLRPVDAHHGAGACHADGVLEIVDRIHHRVRSAGSAVGRPSRAQSFFWTSMISCAWAKRRPSRSISCCIARTLCCEATSASGLRPRLRASRTVVSPRSRCLRQVASNEE